MAKNVHWSIDDLKKKGLAQNSKGDFVPVKSLVNMGKVDKVQSFSLSGVTRPAVTGNRKVKNATKSTNDAGVKFDSTLERYMYDLLTASNMHFEFQKTFELQAKFNYNGEAVRAISKIVDFYLPTRNIIIDTKGFSNDVSPLKHKMLKSVLKHLHDMQPEIIMPKNKKECDLLLNKLLYGNK